MKITPSGYFSSLVVLDGETALIETAGEAEASIVVAPEAGATATVHFSISERQAIENGQGVFVPARGLGAGGAVSAPTIEQIPSKITAVRVQAAGGSVVVEVRE